MDEFKADICSPDNCMNLSNQFLVARKEEYVFKLPPPLVISGTVIDAETKKPIAKFQVVPGVKASEAHMNWVRGKAFTAKGGHYQIRPTEAYFAQLVRIEADGYEAAESRDIKSDEGNVTIDFELTPAKKNILKTTLTPGSVSPQREDLLRTSPSP